MEARQNWHNFRSLVGRLAPAKNGVIALYSGNRIVTGSLTANDPKNRRHFDDQDLVSEHLDATAEVLQHKYQAASVSFVDREALLGMLHELQRSKVPYPMQLEELQQQILNPSPARARLIQHFGEKPAEAAWPRRNFLFQLFTPMFTDLLPERKILLLVVKRSDGTLDTLALEFAGRKLRAFREPDWSNLDIRSLDIFHNESAQRMILWCENHYLLPTFGFFVSEAAWEEAKSLFLRQGARATWRYVDKQISQRDRDREVFLDPLPWPLKASVKWLAFRA